ncbi:hypothetical protein AC062_0080 [Pasteurellaceae bacterium NI1060]|nr:hypothetical protein AC062_0080 [Pasteurellaceae bacterium NI1060]
MTGRFISQDPIGLAGGMNFYRFEGAVQNQLDTLVRSALFLGKCSTKILVSIKFLNENE